jgi:UDP-N-acetylglucosamine 2-epimerase (non-hydrolysing)
VECGSNVLSGADPETIERMVDLATGLRGKWQPPPEYQSSNVADTVCRILLGYLDPDPAEMEWRTGLHA